MKLAKDAEKKKRKEAAPTVEAEAAPVVSYCFSFWVLAVGVFDYSFEASLSSLTTLQLTLNLRCLRVLIENLRLVC